MKEAAIGSQPSAIGENRVRTLRISGELLLSLFSEGPHPGYDVFQDAVPADAELVNARHGWPNYVELTIRSASFDSLVSGSEGPQIVPHMKRL